VLKLQGGQGKPRTRKTGSTKEGKRGLTKRQFPTADRGENSPHSDPGVKGVKRVLNSLQRRERGGELFAKVKQKKVFQGEGVETEASKNWRAAKKQGGGKEDGEKQRNKPGGGVGGKTTKQLCDPTPIFSKSTARKNKRMSGEGCNGKRK